MNDCTVNYARMPLQPRRRAAPVTALSDAMCVRRGQPCRQGGAADPGYQAILERLMQASYGRTQLALDSYLDKVLLPHLDEDARAADQPGGGLAVSGVVYRHDNDHAALALKIARPGTATRTVLVGKRPGFVSSRPDIATNKV
jgi:hypothetical protein